MTRKELAQITEKNIFDSAMELIKLRGLQQVQIKDICNAAGVSVGTFYHYFPSKQSICVRLVDHYNDLLYVHIEEFLKTKPPILEVFLHCARFVEGFGPDLVRELFVYDLIMAGNEESIFTRFERPINLTKEMLHQAFVKSGKAEIAKEGCQMFITLYRGLMYNWCLKKDSFEDAVRKEIGAYLQFVVGVPPIK